MCRGGEWEGLYALFLSMFILNAVLSDSGGWQRLVVGLKCGVGEQVSPTGMSAMTSLGYAMLEHPTRAPQILWQTSGSTQPTSSTEVMDIELNIPMTFPMCKICFPAL